MKSAKINAKKAFVLYQILVLFVLLIGQVTTSFGQAIKIDPIVAKNLAEAKELYTKMSDTGKLVARYSFNDTLRKFQGQVSGAVIKNGLVQSISTVLDDKSFTFNYTLPYKSIKSVSIQPTITGASSKGLIDLFSGNKFARTITAGINFTIPLKGTANFWPEDRDNFKLALKDTDERLQNTTLAKFRSTKQKVIDHLIKFKKDHPDFFETDKLTATNYHDYFVCERELKGVLDNLKELYPENFDPTDNDQVEKFIDDLNNNGNTLLQYIVDVKELKILDSVQSKAPWTHFRFGWITLSPKLNQKDYPIYDATNAENLFTRTENDYYFSLAGSYNILWSYPNSKFFIYPGFSIQNARIFKSTDSLSVQIQKPFATGGDSIKTIKQTGFFPNVANRRWALTMNLPIMYYTSSGLGIDFSAGMKFQPQLSDFNVHLGVFFAVPTKDGQTITLEPVIKYEDDKSLTYASNFAKFSIGFNLSFSIPTFITSSKSK